MLSGALSVPVFPASKKSIRMDCLFCCCSVYDIRIFHFPRPASLVSHFPSIAVHSIALATTEFRFAFVRNPPAGLVSSKFSWCISCEATPKERSHSKLETEEIIKRHNAMKHFFLEECCFSSSETTTLISKDPALFRKKSIDSARQIVQMLRDFGMTAEQVRKAIYKNPNMLTRSALNLKRKIEYLKTLGLAEEIVNKIIFTHPRIFGDSLQGTLAPRLSYLIEVFRSKDKLFRALHRAPGIVSCDIEQVDKKIRVLENAGLVEHEIKLILDKDPRFLCASVGKIEKNMKFLTCTLGFNPNVVVSYPILINLSVEKRMMPRYKVFQYLNLLGVSHDLSITVALLLTEENFARRVLSLSTDVKMLYEKCKGETGDVEVPEL